MAIAPLSRRVFIQNATGRRTILDLARPPCYPRLMNTSVRNAHRKNMTRFGWAVEGVAR